MAGVVRGSNKPFPYGVGDKVGSFTVLEWVNKNKSWQPKMRCSCGWVGVVDRHNIKSGKSTRCTTCAKQKSAETLRRNSGYEVCVNDTTARERLLNRISGCIGRCHNSNDSAYRHYGGRGIQVFEPWRLDRRKFLDYLSKLDGWDNPELQLDRIDNNKGYEPDNLRFVSRSENMHNRRKVGDLQSRILELEAEVASLRRELCRKTE
jgi:hypothetical protein